jgi:signal transduction histidine kinase
LFRGFSFNEKKVFSESQKELSKISNNFIFYYKVRIKLGEIALEQKEFQKAINYFKEIDCVNDNKLLGIKKSRVKHNLGLCYLHLKQFDQSELYLLESVKLREKQKDSLLLIGSYGDLANLYYVQYKDNLAIPYFEKAYNLSKKINDFQLKKTAARNMAVVEENRNDFPKALAYRKEFEQWKDSLNDQNKVWEVAELEKKFAVKQKQKEVTVLQTENKLQVAERNGFLFSTVSLLLLFGAGTFFYRQKVKNNKIILAQKEKLDELNATKDKLFSIVSHDLRSSVNALKTSNTKLQESLETKNFTELDTQLNTNSAITNGAYNLLDNLLHWALLQTKQGYFEITSMRLFYIVEQVSYNYKPLLLDKNIVFENTVVKKDTIDADQESLKIILRNLLDNAIKFSNENGMIKIYSRDTTDNFCDLVIEDNGLGMSENTRLELLKDTALLSKKENEAIIGTGLGMQLVKQMIQKNKGKFNIESELGKGTKMIVSLPKTAS